MTVKAKEIFRRVEELAPPELAEEWDNPGIQVGDPEKEVKRVLLALDADEEACREAEETGAEAIICHHPLIFSPLKSLRTDRPGGALLARLVRAGTVVYAAHTNLDNAERGVGAALAEALALREAEAFPAGRRQKLFKLVTFVPSSHADAVRTALGRAGAGWIGNYSECTFQVRGQGTFRPLAGADPFIGAPGELAFVDEVRLETILPAELVPRVLGAMLAAHPYEEVAYDLYPLANEGKVLGAGRVGFLAGSMSFGEFAAYVKERLNLRHVRCGGDPGREIRRVAVCPGAGASFWKEAAALRADVFVTGDVGYHRAKEMLSAGLSFVDAGHFGTEKVILPFLQKFLQEASRQEGWGIEVAVAGGGADPFTPF
jgi:dinuclear metal center YbgI/SA1388 family protein